MKVKHLFLLLLLGWAVNLVGALFSVEHWAGGGELTQAGWILRLLATLGLLYKLYTYPRVWQLMDH